MENSDVIVVKGVSKKYRLGSKQAYHTLSETITNTARSIFTSSKKPYNLAHESDLNYFWALKNINFNVKTGEIIGIIGKNGAGKSTLLKIISRITSPTEGIVKIKGRIGSLLEVGTGFHPELTGRENIYLNGSILGMRRKEIDIKFEEIVKFSEIDMFLDTPVKRYSSGMYVRLAFSVAAHLETEILLVDEVLAVGDASFQKKCLRMMNTISQEGRTVLFVSHNMSAISTLCNKCIWLDHGFIKDIGNTQQLIKDYYLSNSNLDHEMRFPLEPENLIQITYVATASSDGAIKSAFFSDEAINILIKWHQKRKIFNLDLAFSVNSTQNIPIFSSLYSDSNDDEPDEGFHSYKIKIPGLFLVPGQYLIDIAIWQRNSVVFQKLEGIVIFSVEETGSLQMRHSDGRLGMVTLNLCWEKN